MSSTVAWSGTWTLSKNFHSGTGSTSFAPWWSSGGSTQWAVAQTIGFPNVPLANRGTSGNPYALVVGLGFDVGGYDAAGTVNFKIWSGSGTNIFTGPATSLYDSNQSTNLTRHNLDIISGSRDDDRSGDVPTTSQTPPRITTNTTTGGTTNLKVGVWIRDTYTVATQAQINSAETIEADSSYLTSTASFTNNTAYDWPGRSLIGRIDYIVLPSSPTGPISVTPRARYLEVSWGESDSDGGDPDYFFYVVQAKKTTDSWVDINSPDALYTYVYGKSTTTDIVSVPENGASYNVRVFAVNSATDYLPTPASSPTGYGDSSIPFTSTESWTTIPLPAWSDVTLGDGRINTAYDRSVFAADATSYTVASGSLPTGLSLSESGGVAYISGTPTVVGVYSFVLSATNEAGTVNYSFTITILGGALIWDPATAQWKQGVTKVWNGSAWVTGTVKVYTDGAWKALG
jgi:hypothetical protein